MLLNFVDELIGSLESVRPCLNIVQALVEQSVDATTAEIVGYILLRVLPNVRGMTQYIPQIYEIMSHVHEYLPVDRKSAWFASASQYDLPVLVKAEDGPGVVAVLEFLCSITPSLAIADVTLDQAYYLELIEQLLALAETEDVDLDTMWSVDSDSMLMVSVCDFVQHLVTDLQMMNCVFNAIEKAYDAGKLGAVYFVLGEADIEWPANLIRRIMAEGRPEQLTSTQLYYFMRISGKLLQHLDVNQLQLVLQLLGT